MILGADHLALSAGDAAAMGGRLAAAGMTRAFAAPGIANAPEKRPLLAHHRHEHDIALYQPPGGGMAIEITVHGPDLASPPAPYRPVVTGFATKASDSSDGFAWPAVEPVLSRMAGYDVAAGVWPGVGPVFHGSGAGPDAPLGVRAVVLATPDLEAEARFWTEGLGLSRVEAEAGGWVWLRLASPVPAWRVEMLLAAVPSAPAGWLDSAGFPCLALWSNALERDAERAFAAGGRDGTPAFSSLVNGRALDLLLLRSPGGAIVELIQRAPLSSVSPKKPAADADH